MRRLVVTPLLALATLAADPALAQRGMHSCAKRPPQGWAIRLAPADAKGERLVVTGTLYATDRKTPLPGVTVYVYNTDPAGHYSRDGKMYMDFWLFCPLPTPARASRRTSTSSRSGTACPSRAPRSSSRPSR